MTQTPGCVFKIFDRPETKTRMVTHDMVLILPHTFMIVAAHDPRWARYEKFADKNFRLEYGRLRKLQ